MRHKLFILPCLLLVCVCCSSAADTWVEVRSKNFSVITDAGEKRGKDVALRFEQVRAGFAALFQRFTVNMPVPLQIVAFRNRKEFRLYCHLWNGRPVEVSGFFQASEDRNFIALDLTSENEWGVMFHEYGHLLLNGNLPPTPLWFDEGFADYFSTMKLLGKNLEYGAVPPGYSFILSQNRWMKSVDLFSVGHDSKEYNERDRRSIFYAQSWLTIHYLMSQRKLLELTKYLDLVEKRHVPVADAIRQAFGIEPDKLDKALQAYFRGNSALFFHLPAPPNIEGPSYVTTALDPIAAEATLADLHYHSKDHHAEGITEFKRIIERDPNNVIANRGLGYASLQENDFERASNYFARASAGGSRDPRLHYFKAMLAYRRGTGPQQANEMQSDLLKAIELDPSYADAYSLLALAYSLQGKSNEAEQQAEKAVQLDPRSERLLLNLANLQLQAEDWDKAAVTLERLKDSTNPGIHEAVARDLERLQKIKTRQAQNPGTVPDSADTDAAPPVLKRSRDPNAQPSGPR